MYYKCTFTKQGVNISNKIFKKFLNIGIKIKIFLLIMWDYLNTTAPKIKFLMCRFNQDALENFW